MTGGLATADALQLSPSAVATNADLVVFLVVGVLAGAHCLGMCGPLVGLYADRMGRRAGDDDRLTPFEVRQHALFNGGRVVGYAAVGAGFGLLGGTLFATVDLVAPASDGVRAVAGLLVGGLVVAGGLAYAARGTGASPLDGLPLLPTAFRRVSGLLTARVDALAGTPGIVGLGVVHAVLPCPIIYPAYLYALAVGDPVRGALALGVLGLGTFPTLFAFGTALGTLDAGQRAVLHRALGVAFVVLGSVLVSHGLTLLGVAVPHVDLPYYQPLVEP